MLNRLVDVVGSEVDPKLLIQRVENQFHIQADRIRKQRLTDLASKVLANGQYDEACQLVKLLGYSIKEHSSGFLGTKLEFTVQSPGGAPCRFASAQDLIRWVQSELCA